MTDPIANAQQLLLEARALFWGHVFPAGFAEADNAYREALAAIPQLTAEQASTVYEKSMNAATGVEVPLADRIKAATQQTETVVWSVVRGESPDSRAVEPGPYDITIPDEVLAWAEGYGVGTDTDVYVLVTVADEAGEVLGEIASMTAQATAEDVAAIRAALAECAAER